MRKILATVAAAAALSLLASGASADMALIQVLALDKHPKRTEKGLLFELQDPPRSSKQWLDVAHEHPEFFRVSEHPSVSLIARYVSLDNAAADDPDAVEKADTRLDAEFTSGLLQTAIDMRLTTSALPFLAIAQGRTKLDWRGIGLWRSAAALALYVALIHVHYAVFGISPLP